MKRCMDFCDLGLYDSGLGGKDFADAAEDVALVGVEREELKAVAQALTVAHDGSHF